MAIFMASTQSISRSRGQSAVASACYRAGDKAYDERYGKVHDYSKRSGVMSADSVLPISLQGSSVKIDREKLWNLAESTEKRKNSRVAREWLVNLPYELSEEQRHKLALEFVQALADKFGVITDFAIHKPTAREIAKGADPRNFHCHIMLTTRQAEIGNDGKLSFGDKADCELSDTDRKKLGLCRAKDEVTELRKLWEQLVNAKLVEHGLDHKQVDCRSYKDQGRDVIPQVKVGAKSTQLERRGVATIEGDTNRLIAERNAAVQRKQKLPQLIAMRHHKRKQQQRKQDIKARYQSAKEARYERERQRKSAEAQRAAKLAAINDSLRAAADQDRRAQSALTSADQRIDAAKRAIERSKRQLDKSKQRAASSADAVDTRDRARQRLNQQIDSRKQRQRDVDNAITSVNNRIGRRKYEIDDFKQHIEKNVRILSAIIRHRHGRNHKLDAFERSDQHPDKFDDRQLSIIDHFVKNTNLEFDFKTGTSEQAHIELCLRTFDDKFFEKHHEVLRLIANPKLERQNYDAITKIFNDFIVQNQAQQESDRQNLKLKRNSLSGIADNIEYFATSTAYLKRLDDFIRDQNTHPINIELAQSHKAEMIQSACNSYRNACNALAGGNLQAHHQQSQLAALNHAKDEFLNHYQHQLDDEQKAQFAKSTQKLETGHLRSPKLTPKFRR